MVDQSPENAGSRSDSQPKQLSLDEVIDVSVAVLGKGTGTEEHHHPEDDQPQHGGDQDVDAGPLHGITCPSASRWVGERAVSDRSGSSSDR